MCSKKIPDHLAGNYGQRSCPRWKLTSVQSSLVTDMGTVICIFIMYSNLCVNIHENAKQLCRLYAWKSGGHLSPTIYAALTNSTQFLQLLCYTLRLQFLCLFFSTTPSPPPPKSSRIIHFYSSFLGILCENVEHLSNFFPSGAPLAHVIIVYLSREKH